MMVDFHEIRQFKSILVGFHTTQDPESSTRDPKSTDWDLESDNLHGNNNKVTK